MPSNAPPGARALAILAIPALAIGVVSALILWLLNAISGVLQEQIWTTWPDALGLEPYSPWWTFGVLTLTGAAVGLVVWLMPGHAGPDSATTELSASPLPLRVLPGLALAVTISLAGGVSLGPENPIIAINTAVAVTAMARFATAVPTPLVALLASAATIGALFGTPVAAALVFTGIVAALKAGGSLWDRLFLPVAAAGAGALTMHVLGTPPLAFKVAPFGTPEAIDLATGTLVAVVSAGLGIIAVYAFPLIHRAFHALRNPVVFTTLGGAVLGVLAVIGGPLTMFKGLDQAGQLIDNPDDYSAGTLALLTVVKLVALLIAAAAGFRGGRVFPAVFIGVATGLFFHSVIPSMPIGLAIACGVLGIVLVVTRDGWIALFVGVALTGDTTLLPILCVIVLPTWLLVTGVPELRIISRPPPDPVSQPQPDAADGR
ncbi:ion channel protein [Leifsonia sp. YIM 134122]|uniref:Ion channel protein n=1 Tax=Leifsonia stereocauli TaxID=3134136 RepID=A0ABU9W0H2_9MICO